MPAPCCEPVQDPSRPLPSALLCGDSVVLSASDPLSDAVGEGTLVSLSDLTLTRTLTLPLPLSLPLPPYPYT